MRQRATCYLLLLFLLLPLLFSVIFLSVFFWVSDETLSFPYTLSFLLFHAVSFLFILFISLSPGSCKDIFGGRCSCGKKEGTHLIIIYNIKLHTVAHPSVTYIHSRKCLMLNRFIQNDQFTQRRWSLAFTSSAFITRTGHNEENNATLCTR